jgi:hypothetical protein
VEHYHPDQPKALASLGERLKGRLHETVLLGPEVALEHLGPTASGEIERQVKEGRLRLLGFGEQIAERHSLWVASSRLSVADAFRALEAQAIEQLENGRVDGSFWSTVETLEMLEALGGRVNTDRSIAAPAIRAVKQRIRDDGSFDQTPAATCALLWLLHTFGDPGADRTAEWLARVVARPTTDGFPGEALMALTTLARTHRPWDEERLDALLAAAGDVTKLRDHDLLIGLQAALETGRNDRARAFASELVATRQHPGTGAWADIETTASTIRALAELHTRAVDIPGLERSLVRASFHIRRTAQLDAARPWGDRVSTSLMCMHALTLVNEMLHIPIGETVEAIRHERLAAEFRTAGAAAADAAEALRRSNADLRSHIEAANTERDQKAEEAATAEAETRRMTEEAENAQQTADKLRRTRRLLIVALVALTYLLGAVVNAAISGSHETAQDLLNDFGDGLAIHLTVLGLIVAVGLGIEQIVVGLLALSRSRHPKDSR